MTALSLLAGICSCQQLENRVDELSSRVDDIENSQGGIVQSIVFVPEYSDGNARVHYNMKEDGSFIPEELTLRFAVAPSEFADKLASEWETSLSIEATYTRTKAVSVGDAISFPILEVSASDGKLIITASADALDQAFFRKELAASVRLTVSLEGICKSSEFVPVVPSANMGQGDEFNVPDIYFKTYLVDNFDVNGDGEISSDEALAVKEINIASSSLPICSLAGIEHFTKLESLDCSGNHLAVLDLSSNVALRYLNCSNNSLTELDLSEKLYLTDVDCSNNKITKLALSNACVLRNLDCSNNAIEEIDLHDNQFILKLECYGNPVKKLILDNNAELEHLFIKSNDYDAIEGDAITISGIRSLESLALSGDYTDIIVSGCALSTIDVSNYPSLVLLNVAGNSLQKIDVSNNPMLEELNVSYNALSSVNVRNNIALKTLNISGNRDIFFVDLCNNPALEDLNASGLSISDLDLTPITQLKTLDVTDNPDLTRLICPSQDWLNNISEIFASPSLFYADIDGNELYDYIEIDGVKWARWNAGYTEADRYGGTYDFVDAQNACPDGWRTPTKSEFESLSVHCSRPALFNKITGLWFSGSKTYSSSVPAIFLPDRDYYWSSTLYSGNTYFAYALNYDGVDINASEYHYFVRCVKE